MPCIKERAKHAGMNTRKKIRVQKNWQPVRIWLFARRSLEDRPHDTQPEQRGRRNACPREGSAEE